MSSNAARGDAPGGRQRDSGWRAWRRVLVSQAWIVMLLLVLATIASIIIDVAESATPATVPFDVCVANHGPVTFSGPWSVLLSPVGVDDSYCQWEDLGTRKEQEQRKLAVQLTVSKNGLLQANITIVTSRSDPLVSQVRAGDAVQDPAAFVIGLGGFIQVGQYVPNWLPPTVSAGSGSMAVIAQTGTVRSAAPEEITVEFGIPGNLRATAQDQILTGIQGSAYAVNSQDAHSISARLGAFSSMTIDLAASRPSSSVLTPPSSAVGPWGTEASVIWQHLKSLTGAAWQALVSFVGALLPGVAWIALLLAGRVGALGAIHRRVAWRRVDWAVAMVLLAHLTISWTSALAGQENAVGAALSSPGTRLVQALALPEFPGGYIAVDGGTLLLITAILCGAAWWSRPLLAPSHDGPARRARRALLGLAVVLAAAGIQAGLAWRLVRRINSVPFNSEPYSDVWLSVALALFWLLPLLLALGYVAALLRAWPRSFFPVAAGLRLPRVPLGGSRVVLSAGVLLALAACASLTPDSGIVPVALRWGVVIVTGTVLGVAVARLVISATGWSGRPGSSPAVVALAAAIAVPWGIAGTNAALVGWWSALDYAVRVDDLLPLVLLVAGAAALRKLGTAPVTDEPSLRNYRTLGVLVWFIVLSSSYTLAGTFNWQAVLTAIAAALGAWLLMPSSQVALSSTVLRQSSREQTDAVQETLLAGAARRVVPAYSKAMLDKVTNGKLPLGRAQRKISEMEEIASRASALGTGSALATARQRGFGSLTSRRPWQRGLWGAAAGTIIGAPWVLLGLAGARFSPGPLEGYPEVALLASIAPLALRWTAYGFAFGYFYPLIRGDTGLGKAIWFTAAAATPALLSAAAVGSTARQWDSIALLIIQIATFATTLGILADRAVLRRHRLPDRRLMDLHNLWMVSAWASSLGIAAATGIATIIIAGLQPFVIGLITPSSTPAAPHTPPAAVSPSNQPSVPLRMTA
jgi:hypothetical protein